MNLTSQLFRAKRQLKKCPDGTTCVFLGTWGKCTLNLSLLLSTAAELDPAHDDGGAPAREVECGEGKVSRRRRVLGRRRPRKRQRRRRAAENGAG